MLTNISPTFPDLTKLNIHGTYYNIPTSVNIWTDKIYLSTGYQEDTSLSISHTEIST